MTKNKYNYLIFTFTLAHLLLFSWVSHATSTSPTINSGAAILIDGDTGQILYEKSANTPMYPASITKLMTALLSIEALDPTDTITFSDEAIDRVDAGGSRIGIHPGEVLTVNDALHGLLLMSANEVANGLAEQTNHSIDSFVQSMNTRAKELGAFNTNFTNPHGLFEPAHQTTAYDMALITRELIKHPYFLEIMGHSTYEIPISNKSEETRLLYQQHKMLNSKNDLTIYRDDVIAGKVGYTSQSKNTLVTVAKKESRTLIVVIMQADANDVYSDTKGLLDYGFDSYKQVFLSASDFSNTQPLYDNGVVIGSVDLTLSEDTNLCIPTDSEVEHLVYSVAPPTSYGHPLASKQLFGNTTLSIGSNELTSLPLRIESIEYNIDDSISSENQDKYTPDALPESSVNDDKTNNPWKLLISLVFISSIGIMGFIFKVL